MKADGIDARLLVDEKAPSGTALILVDATGQNMISVAPGANAALAPEDLAPFETLMKEASVVVLQLETPVESVLAAAKMAHRAGAKVILNPAPARKLPRELYGLVDYLTPNETEAEILTGVKVVDAASAQKATSILMRRGVGHVIITMAAKGCWCGACERIYPVKRVKAIDCVAAGDTFNGAFAVAVTEGLSCADAIAFAQKASAIAVTRKGAQASIPFRKELDA
jgi:ribokinase